MFVVDIYTVLSFSLTSFTVRIYNTLFNKLATVLRLLIDKYYHMRMRITFLMLQA